MSSADLNGQVSVQDPQNPIIEEILIHPDFRIIAAFFLGWVFLSSVYHASSSTLLRGALSRLFLRCSFRRTKKKNVGDVEAPTSHEKISTIADSDELPRARRDIDDSALVFILNLCFAFAGLAEFCSLLDLGGPNGDTVACAFVIAWGSMAAQSARIAGLLMLSWKLSRLGAKRWEIYIFWAGLLSVLGLVFALNATGTGTTSLIGPNGMSICYKRYFLPLSVSLSATLLALELYTIVRFVSIGLARSQAWSIYSSLFNINVARAASLLVLDGCTAVPAAIWVNTLAQYIPFALGALLVIAVYNHSERRYGYGNRRQGLDHSGGNSVFNVQRLSNNSLLTPSPFLLHFLDSPIHPGPPQQNTRASYHARPPPGLDQDIVLDIRRDEEDSSDFDYEDVPPPPHSAPAILDGPMQKENSRPRRILPFQVQYMERLEQEEAAVSTGPIVRQPRERPQVFVVVDENDEDAPRDARNSRATVFGSDIIRIAPRTPRRKRQDSRLWSPQSAVPSSFVAPSTRHSAQRPHSTLRNSIFSAYAHLRRSPSTETPSAYTPRHSSQPDSMLSPQESTGMYSWRLWNRQSPISSPATGRDELPTVIERSPDRTERPSLTPSSTFGRSKRQTFGQSWKNGRQIDKRFSTMSRDSLAPIVVPPPSLVRFGRSPREVIPPLPITPLPAVSPPPLASPYGAGRGAGLLLGGTGVIRGPRPPPSPNALLSPVIAKRRDADDSPDEVRSPALSADSGHASHGHT